MRFFGKFLHEILNISRPCGQILMKSCPLELRPCRLWFWRREVQENSVARERLASRLEKLTKFSEKWPLVRYSSIFWPCRGLTHLERSIRPSKQYHMARRDGDCFLCRRAGRKSKISILKISLFRGDVSVIGVVINIARHSIGYIFLGSFVYWQIRFWYKQLNQLLKSC